MTAKIPFSEAKALLTFAEVDAIERHFGRCYGLEPHTQGAMSVFQTLHGVMWAWSRRQCLAEDRPLTTWEEAGGWTERDADEFFAKEPVEVDDDDPDSDSGKGS